MYIKLFWSGTDDNDIARKVLSYIPDDFSGNLLDVPVGTAVFTERKWKSLKNAQITCLDYSVDMLEQARKDLMVRHISGVFRAMWEIYSWIMNPLISLSA